MTTVVIADPQPLSRSALSQLLTELGMEVVGEFSDGTDALHGTLRLAPSLLILDLALPRLGGLEVLSRLRQQESAVKALVITAQSSEHFAGLSLQAGATGFIGKHEPLGQIRHAVKTVLSGHSYFPAQSLGTVASPAVAGSETTQLASLSPREVTVLNYLGQGLSNKQIADTLLLSDRTVSTYKARLLQKLNVGSLAQLLELAWRQGLLAVMPSIEKAESSNDDELRRMFDAVPLPIGLRDLEGRLIACNSDYLLFHGVTKEQAKGMRLSDSAHLDPRDAARMQQNYLAAVARAQPFSVEATYLYQGQRRVSRFWGVPYVKEDNGLVGMLCSSVDISAHEQELTELMHEKLTHQSHRNRRALFLHDLGEHAKPLLKTVQLAVNNLSSQLPEEHDLKIAKHALSELHDFLDKLLDVLSIERGTLQLLPHVIELRRLTEQTLQPLAPTVEVVGNFEAAWCWVDAPRYQQLLCTLVEYLCDQGLTELELRCEVESAQHAQMTWRLAIGPATQNPSGQSYAPAPEQMDLNLVLATRLSALLGGSLNMFTESLHLQVVIHVPQALQT